MTGKVWKSKGKWEDFDIGGLQSESDFYKCKLYHIDIIIIVSPAYCGAFLSLPAQALVIYVWLAQCLTSSN